MTTVLCVPQWQGSASDSARRLTAGALGVADLIPADAKVTVPVVEDTSPKVDGIFSLDSLARNHRMIADGVASIDDFIITVGGECSVDIAPIAAAQRRHGPSLTVLWIDAHPDVYSPQTLPSGAFHGMVVRVLLGDVPTPLTPSSPLAPGQIVIVGERAGSPSEHLYIKETGLRRHGVEDLQAVFDQVSGPLYVHIDLDVLEPTRFESVCYPEPNGLDPKVLADMVASLSNVVGAAITEPAPRGGVFSEAEVESIRELGAALVSVGVKP